MASLQSLTRIIDQNGRAAPEFLRWLAAYVREAWPVGSIFATVNEQNPANLIGYGRWEAFGAGRVLVGQDATDPDFATLEGEGGGKTTEASAHTGTAVSPHEGAAVSPHAGTAVAPHDNHTHEVTTAVTAETGQFAAGDESVAVTAVVNSTVTSSGTSVTLEHVVTQPNDHTVTQPSDHEVTQPDDHDPISVLQPYIVVRLWKRVS